jgi:hypothetical protein
MRAMLPAGQGARYLCAECRKPIAISQIGRTAKYCAPACREQAYRQRVFRREGSYYPTGPAQKPRRNPEKTPAKSTTSLLRIVAGPPVSVANLLVGFNNTNPAKPLDPAERRELIKRAVEVELGARWPRGGVQ